MKSILTILFALHFFTPIVTFSQLAPDRGRQPAEVKVLPINDVEETSIGISGMLKTKLALSDVQGPKVAELLTEFLKSNQVFCHSQKAILQTTRANSWVFKTNSLKA